MIVVRLLKMKLLSISTRSEVTDDFVPICVSFIFEPCLYLKLYFLHMIIVLNSPG